MLVKIRFSVVSSHSLILWNITCSGIWCSWSPTWTSLSMGSTQKNIHWPALEWYYNTSIAEAEMNSSLSEHDRDAANWVLLKHVHWPFPRSMVNITKAAGWGSFQSCGPRSFRQSVMNSQNYIWLSGLVNINKVDSTHTTTCIVLWWILNPD